MNPHEMFRLAYLVNRLTDSNRASGPKPPIPNPRCHSPLPHDLVA